MIWLFHFTVTTFLLLITIRIKKEEFFIKSSFFYALFIFGQRWMTGTDFPNYLKYYLSGFQVQEPIYRFIQMFLATNNLYFGILIFTIFFITLYNNYRFIIKVNKNVVLMLYIFLLSEIFFTQLSQVRQFVAISFFINAFFNVYEKKYKHSLINLMLGAGFHTSIIYLVPFLFIRLNIDRVKAVYLLIIASVLPLLDITLLLNLPFFSRYSHYIESRFNVNLSIFHYFKFYLLLLIIFVFIWNLKKYKRLPVDQMILNGILFNMLIYGFSFQFAPMIRLSAYFKIFEILFIFYFVNDVGNYSKEVIKGAVLSFFILVYIGLGITDPFNITNYQFRHLRIYDERSVEQLQEETEVSW